MTPAAPRWPSRVEEARALQERLRRRVRTRGRLPRVRRIAGLDASYDRHTGTTRAVAALLSFPDFDLIEYAKVERRTRFPYVPGYLSFREAPAVLAALDRLSVRPDLVMCDGHGLAHPRRFGLACHVGVLARLPTLGVAKSRLIGTHAEPGRARGSRVPLVDSGEVVGSVLRTRTGVKPVYVSVGHRVSLERAVELVLACSYTRIPEPTRVADRLAGGRPAAPSAHQPAPPPPR